MKSLIYLSAIMFFTFSVNAQVGIGTISPNGALDITSTTDGLLIPRVALTAAITVLPVITGTTSELVYNTATISDVTPGFYYLSTATGPWVRLGASASTGWLLDGNPSVTSTNFIGSINNADVIFKRQNTEAGRISAKNTSFGLNALGNANQGDENTAIGSGALGSTNSAGSRFNTAVGYNALSSSSNTTNCVAVGANALLQNTAIKNTAVGFNALQGNSSQEGNTAVGNEALNNAGGSSNTAVGFQAGFVSGSQNIFIGYQAGNTGAGNNNVVLGYQATVGTASNTIRMGNTSITDADIQVGWTVTSDRRYKSNIKDSEFGLDFIKTLRPVSYFRNNDENKKTEYGFIAQEVEEAFIKAGDGNNGVISINDDGMYGVRYNDFIPMTIKAVQEQQVLLEELQKTNTELQKTNAAILKRLEALEREK